MNEPTIPGVRPLGRTSNPNASEKRSDTPAAAPPAGFYKDPVDGEGQRYWDGTQWTEHEKSDTAPKTPKPSYGEPERSYGAFEPSHGTPELTVQQSGVSKFLGANGTLEEIGHEATQLYRRNKDTAHKVAGGALVADGFIGFGRNRQGIGGALMQVLIGAVFVAVGLMTFTAMSNDSKVETPVEAQAAVLTAPSYGSSSSSSSQAGSGACGLTYEYVVDGQTYEGRSTFGSSTFCGYGPGTPVKIVYDANSPQISSLDEPIAGMFKYFPLIFVAAGGLLSLSGAWIFLVRAAQIVGGSVLFVKARNSQRRKTEGA